MLIVMTSWLIIYIWLIWLAYGSSFLVASRVGCQSRGGCNTNNLYRVGKKKTRLINFTRRKIYVCVVWHFILLFFFFFIYIWLFLQHTNSIVNWYKPHPSNLSTPNDIASYGIYCIYIYWRFHTTTTILGIIHSFGHICRYYIPYWNIIH